MRTGLSTIQQTLTPEAASVLNNSIAEAARRNHGQTTPLHVAATLLAAPTGLLRQACVRSHPNSSHPLQCRALELCFSVALDRLPSTSNPQSDSNTSTEPPISNALMAALKRAQAHQRRGCPEQQQSPLLAVKVELEQLVVSILDDPSVSRVMKEASFSSPAVKATIEQSLASASSASSSSPKSPSLNSPSPSAAGLGLGLGTRPATARNLYMNPRLQQQRQGNGGIGGGDTQRKDEVKKVMEILMKTNKKNPVLVGDSDLNAVMKEVLERIERRELGCLVKVISLEKEFASTADKTQIPSRIKELGVLIETQIRSSSSCGVVLDLGDLKWLVESNGEIGGLTGSGPTQQQKVVSEMGRAAVAEMGRIIGRFGEAAGSSGSRVWVIGTATYATYLRCQVYHPTIESEWDLQAVLTAPRSPLPGLFPRVGSNGILSSSVEALAPPKGFPPIKPTPIPLRRPSDSTTDMPQKPSLCSQCMGNYERELAKLVANQFEKSSSDSRLETRPALPQWLQIATAGSTKPSPDQLQTKEHEPNWKQNMEELLKRWRQTCSRLHPNSSNPRSFQPKLILSQGFPSLQVANSSDRPISPPGSPVKTDLVLGNPKPLDTSPLEKAHRERIKDFPGCKQDKFSDKRSVRVASFEDSDSLKRLFKGLIEKVGWQPDAASAVTAAVMNSKSGNGKRRGITPKTDTWLLFIGSDKVGKRKMANALAELVFGAGPITVCLGSPRTNGDDGGLSDVNFRGKTSLDRVAEAIRQNPFSVIVLEDIDRADAIVRGTIKQAIERGRLPDSHGREVGLGSAIFVLTADWLPDELKNSQDSLLRLEEKILNSANSGWQLELSVGGKRRLEWLSKDDPAKRRKESNGLSLSLDLNLAAGSSRDDDAGESSRNSSDLTVEHGHEHGRLAIKHSASLSPSLTSELIDSVDDAVVFKPVDFVPLRRRISGSIFAKFASIMGNERLIRIDDDVLDRMVGSVWVGGAAFEEWAERVLVPGIERLRANLKVDDGAAIHLSTVEISGLLRRSAVAGDWLPSKVTVAGDGIREV